MAVRLLTYVSLLLEEIIHREKLKPGDRLPAVLPLVLYNGKRPWRGQSIWPASSRRCRRGCGAIFPGYGS